MSKKITCKIIKSAPLTESSTALLHLHRLRDENRGIFETALPDMLPAYPGSLPVYTGLASSFQVSADVHFLDCCA
jgi:hypothetical protein